MRKKIKDNPSKGLLFLYNSLVGRMILKVLVYNSFFSKLMGWIVDQKISKLFIKPFIKSNNINMEEVVDLNFKSFNDFFIRKLKPQLRLVESNKNSFISPCDAKLTCYKINKNLLFKVKKSTYSASSILKSKEDALKYKDGYCLVFRLSPEDYHRYCFIDDGKIIKHKKVQGLYHTVNPIVYDKHSVFKENSREISLLDTKNFGKIFFIEVGALFISRINNYKKCGEFKKGEEKGFFQFGGSTIVIFLEKNVIKVDEDILDNSKNGYETCVKYGEKIAQKLD